MNALVEQRLKAWTDCRSILDNARAENRSMTGEETKRYNALEGEMRSLTDTIDAEGRAAKLEAFMNAPAPTLGVPSGDPITPAQRIGESDYASVFRSYLHRGIGAMPMETRTAFEREGFRKIESRDMSTTGSAGGYMVPPGFLAKLTEVQKFFGGVRQVANVVQTETGQSLVWPGNDDTANPATIIGETTQVGELDLAFTQKTLASYMWSSGVARVSRQLVTDAFLDIESLLARKFGQRFGRGENAAFTTGSGISGGLIGVTAGVTFGTAVDPLAQATLGAVLQYTTLIDLVHSVDAAYRAAGNCVFMMNDKSVSKVQKLTDVQGRPLFIPGGAYGSLATGVNAKNLNSGGGAGVDTLLGFPIIVNNDLADSAGTGSGVPIIFGDFHQGYIIRDVTNSSVVLRLEERYADYGEIGFIAFQRCDGTRDDVAALRALVNHA